MSFNKLDQYNDFNTAEEECRELNGPTAIVIPLDLMARIQNLESEVSNLTWQLSNLRLEFKSRFDRC